MKVSVLVVTYNHEPFVDQALASVMGQETDFEFEVIVSEDASTDATRRIVLEWQRRHPGRIRTLLSERNVRTNEVVARGLRAASGTYVALLDGDDLWTSPRKLRTQAQFLDENPECALCFHNAAVIDASGNAVEGRRWTPDDQRARSGLEDIWLGNPIATCSVMLRKSALSELPAWYSEFFPITDWPLYILCAEHGQIGYVPEVMAAYRLHPGGLYSPLPPAAKLEATARFYERMNQRTGYRHDRLARKAQRRFFLDWARVYVHEGRSDLARTCLALSLRAGWPRSAGDLAETLRFGLAALRPSRSRADAS